MKQQVSQFLKKNKYIFISFIFTYVIPFVLLVILATQSKSTNVSIKLWGCVVGLIMIIVYFAKFSKWIDNKVEFEKHEQLKVPVWLRVLQLFVSVLAFVIIYLVLSTMKIMFDEVILFVICCGVSVVIGKLFLIVDSKNRVAHKISRT